MRELTVVKNKITGRNPTQDPVGFNRILQDPIGSCRILNCRNPTQDPIGFNRILSKIL